ncbi:MAG: molecular chaperone TorD family protein [Candidatus Tectomicrobia bacterium]|uniref:Molecular chaperone TorD family protein n=1 Tax=Tectimicrobiota bacterium TaxID=2528274 RepID=A0A933GNA8_UNCTE|nr:molecular chaperone TorD family protein [Candidatus Tectomicrobia bacterium]
MNEVQRAHVYGFLAHALAYPRREIFEILSHGNILEAFNGLEGKLVTQAHQIIELLRTLGYEKVCEEYARTFGHTISTECPPYETSYGEAHIFQQTQEMADIAGFYRAWGLDLSSDAHDRLDHISAECEFMSFLLLKLDYFLSKGEKEAEEICLDSSRKFFKEHLGKWAPLFSKLLMRKASGGLFHQVAEILREFIEKERQLFGVESLEYTEKDFPSVAFEDGACSQCEPSGHEGLKEELKY